MKFFDPEHLRIIRPSPSMRREWIEMAKQFYVAGKRESPSMRREWIEINPIDA